MSLPVARGLTIHDLEQLPDDNLRRELIDGELYVTPPPALPHQDAVRNLTIALGLFVREHGGRIWPAPTGVIFAPTTTDTMVEPDVVVLSAATAAALENDRYVDVVADLVVEVSSPSTRRLDLIKKRALYEQRGVAEYWFVDLDAEAVDAHVLSEGGHYGEPTTHGRGDPVASRILTGFSIPVEAILAKV